MTDKVDTLVRDYIRIRDAKAELAAKHKLELVRYNKALENIEHRLMAELNQAGAESVRTAEGTFYREMVDSATVETPDAYWPWLFSLSDEMMRVFLTNHISKDAVRQFLESSGGQVPPGIKYSTFYSLKVRRS